MRFDRINLQTEPQPGAILGGGDERNKEDEMQTEKKLGEVIAWLDGDSIENAGFDASKMTPEQFNTIRISMERQVDDCWNSMIHKACEGVLDPLED